MRMLMFVLVLVLMLFMITLVFFDFQSGEGELFGSSHFIVVIMLMIVVSVMMSVRAMFTIVSPVMMVVHSSLIEAHNRLKFITFPIFRNEFGSVLGFICMLGAEESLSTSEAIRSEDAFLGLVFFNRFDN